MSDSYDSNLDDYLVDEQADQIPRDLPHSADAERAVLACIMKDDTAWDKLTGLIEASDFYEPRHVKIFEAMHLLATQGNPLNQVTVSDALRNVDKLNEVGGYPYLFEINETMHDPRVVETYAEMIRGTALRRDIIGVASYIKNIATLPGELKPEDVLAESETKVLGLSKDKTGEKFHHSLAEVLTPTVTRIEQLRESGGRLPGLRSGFWDLDDLTGGFHNNDLIIVAGRPSMGKTSFALNICEHVILDEKPHPVLFFSLEQDHEQLVMRMLASQSSVGFNKLERADLNAQQWKQLESATAMLTAKPFFVVDKPSISVDEMRSYARRVSREIRARNRREQTGDSSELSLIVVDYLQLVRASRRIDSRVLELGDITRSLKTLAKEFKVPVIALSQLNRKLEERNDKRPKMSDLRDSGEIEQAADLITFIYRDEVYDEETEDRGKAEIIVAKHRNGPRGTLKLNFTEQLMKFEGPESEYASDRRSGATEEPKNRREADDDDSPPPWA